jgi:DNA recombination protein RmuC
MMDSIGLALIVAALGAGFAIGWMRGKQMLAGAVSRPDYDKAIEEKTALAARLDAMLADRKELAEKLEKTESTLTEYRERAIKAETSLKTEQQKLLEQKQLLKVEFENTANAMLEKINAKFIDQSEKKIGDLLNPVQEKLNDFKKLVTDSFSEQGKEQRSLKDVISAITLQADGLTKALRGDVKAQGNWGEIMLERILEQSGLEKGVAYTTQGEDMQLKTEDGSRQRPDVIVHLPDGKHLIIDSKVSLTAYDRYCSATDDVRSAHLKDFVASVRGHITNLADKDYARNAGLAAPDFVMLFMPIEGAFSLAVQHDPELHAFAWGKRIVMVSPNNLFAIMQTAASLWRIEKSNRNAEDIAYRGAQLYDKFVGFVEDMQAIGKQLDVTRGKYDAALGKLAQGPGNLVRQSEEMRKLGLKAKKQLPKELTLDDEMPMLAQTQG